MRESMYKNLESEYSSMKNVLNDSRQKCQDLRAALASNKDDTKYIYELWAQAREDIEKLKERVAFAERKAKNAYIYGSVVTAIPGILVFTKGVVDMVTWYSEGHTTKEGGANALTWIYAGLVTEVGMQLVYQGGHWVFNWW